MTEITLTYLGKTWTWSGDLFYMTRQDKHGRQEARCLSDGLGETWVDIRRVPEGGYFATERVISFPCRMAKARQVLLDQGFERFRYAQGNATEAPEDFQDS